MISINNRKKSVLAAVGAAVASAAVPAVLFSGAGTAQAETAIVPFPDPVGISVKIASIGPAFSSGWCTYTAWPSDPAVPIVGLPFYLEEKHTQTLWFPGKKTGKTWDVTVDCPNGADNPQPVQIAY
jgi:hypothetical protein